MHKHNVSVSLCKLHSLNSPRRYCVEFSKLNDGKERYVFADIPARARDIRSRKVMKRYFFATDPPETVIRQRRLPVILICSKTFSKKEGISPPRRLTRGAPTTCRDTGSLLTSLTLPLILLEARHIYWPCCSYVTFVRINRWPVPHSNGMRPSVNICAHLHTTRRNLPD